MRTKFEEEFASLTGNKYAVATCNGTLATVAALNALGIHDGFVDVPAFTFISVANAVVHVGATPHFIDIRPDTLCMNSQDVTSTKCICVHTFGETCKLPNHTNHIIIEDCCQNLFANEGGDVRVYSFYGMDRGKQLKLGEGGAVGTDNELLAERVRKFCNHGRSDRFTFDGFGLNYRMNPIIAELGLQKIRDEEFDKVYMGGGTESGFYPYVIYEQPIYKQLGIGGDCPVAEGVARRVREFNKNEWTL